MKHTLWVLKMLQTVSKKSKEFLLNMVLSFFIISGIYGLFLLIYFIAIKISLFGIFLSLFMVLIGFAAIFYLIWEK